jgi:hypothetical protein
MNLVLYSGDNDWSEDGYHIFNECGIALVLSEGKEIEVTQEVYDRILPIIQEARDNRGFVIPE